MTTIKSIYTKNYSLELLETFNGYVILWSKSQENRLSERIRDYNVASHLFDLKLQELQGH